MFGKKTTINPDTPGTKSFDFHLGDEVKDKINGLTGIAISRIYHVTGCDTFLVELPPADGKPGSHMNVNGDRLELVTSYADRHIDEIPDDDVCLGDKAKCLTTGVVGIVTLIEVPLFGTTRVCIEPGFNEKEKKVGEGWMTDTNVVEVIEPLKPKTTVEAGDPVVAEPAPQPKRRGASRLPANF